MTSKAARRRKRVILAKGGRPRLEGPREPNGRLDRTWREKDTAKSAVQTVTKARQRRWGLSEVDARKEEAMTVLGRLKLAHDASGDRAIGIDRDQYQAAEEWQKIRQCYQRAKGFVPDYVEPRSEEGATGKPYEDWVAEAISRYDAMAEVLTELCVSLRSPAPKAALEVIILRDHEMPELVGALRLALNALAKHFAGEKVRAPAMA